MEEIPRGALKQLCEVSALDREANDAYPVSIQVIQEAQEKGDDLRKAIASDKKSVVFGSQDFNGIKVGTFHLQR